MNRKPPPQPTAQKILSAYPVNIADNVGKYFATPRFSVNLLCCVACIGSQDFIEHEDIAKMATRDEKTFLCCKL